MHLIDSINAPGGAHGAGDDRYGFDEAAGTAWVIDGATDVGAIRLFPQAESDAAWYADALSARLLSGPRPAEPATAYMARVLEDVAARLARDADHDMAHVPRDSWPLASLLWLRQTADSVEIVQIGDCAAVFQTDAGVQAFSDVERTEREAAAAAQMAHWDWGDKLPALRDSRVEYNTPGFCWPDPDRRPRALDVMRVSRLSLGPRQAHAPRHALLMSDGLFRLVSPFHAYDEPGLMQLVLEQGLGEAVTRLRALETAPQGPARHKSSDDAAGLLLAL